MCLYYGCDYVISHIFRINKINLNIKIDWTISLSVGPSYIQVPCHYRIFRTK